MRPPAWLRVGPAPRTLLLAAAVFAASCSDDDVAGPRLVPEPGGELFLRYVSLGNSITAGFQSGGIHEGLQNEAYPVLLAEKAGATFGVPALRYPGCPPPLAAPLGGERIGVVPCSFRTPEPPPLVQNLAVPGHRMADALAASGGGSNPLASLLLDGRTQVQAMREAEPTLVSVWLGNNDVLAAALTGDTTRLTATPAFEAALADVVTAITGTTARDAILIGVADPILIAPALQPGAYFWAAAESGRSPVPLVVGDDCAPGTPGGARWVSLLVASAYIAGEVDSVRVDCAPDAAYVLDEGETAAVVARVDAFNRAIRAAAEENGWLYIDPNTSFVAPALADPDLVRKCQGLAAATTAAEIEAALAETCPGPEAPNFFGLHFSFDGVHPSSAAHAVIADTLARRLNARHGLTLP